MPSHLSLLLLYCNLDALLEVDDTKSLIKIITTISLLFITLLLLCFANVPLLLSSLYQSIYFSSLRFTHSKSAFNIISSSFVVVIRLHTTTSANYHIFSRLHTSQVLFVTTRGGKNTQIHNNRPEHIAHRTNLPNEPEQRNTKNTRQTLQYTYLNL